MPIGKKKPFPGFEKYDPAAWGAGMPAIQLSDEKFKETFNLSASLVTKALDQFSGVVTISSAALQDLSDTVKGNKMAVKVKTKNQFQDHLGKVAPAHSVGQAVGFSSIEKKLDGKVVPAKHDHEVIHESGFIAPHKLCHIHFEGSHKVNLGNYESAEVRVGITMPCTKDDLVEAYGFASDWVSQKIQEGTKDLKGE